MKLGFWSKPGEMLILQLLRDPIFIVGIAI